MHRTVDIYSRGDVDYQVLGVITGTAAVAKAREVAGRSCAQGRMFLDEVQHTAHAPSRGLQRKDNKVMSEYAFATL